MEHFRPDRSGARRGPGVAALARVELRRLPALHPDRGAFERLYPVGHSVADGELAALGRASGVSVRVTGHVLQRSFGRLAYQAGVPVPTIQRIYGHASLDQTLHYVGVGEEEMTEGFAVFDRHLSRGLEGPISVP